MFLAQPIIPQLPFYITNVFFMFFYKNGNNLYILSTNAYQNQMTIIGDIFIQKLLF
jgi:hypothetical protein